MAFDWDFGGASGGFIAAGPYDDAFEELQQDNLDDQVSAVDGLASRVFGSYGNLADLIGRKLQETQGTHPEQYGDEMIPPAEPFTPPPQMDWREQQRQQRLEANRQADISAERGADEAGTTNPLALPFGAWNAAEDATRIPYLSDFIEQKVRPAAADVFNASPVGGSLELARGGLGALGLDVPDAGETLSGLIPSTGLDIGMTAAPLAGEIGRGTQLARDIALDRLTARGVPEFTGSRAFHWTPDANVASIQERGLDPGSWLAGSPEEALRKARLGNRVSNALGLGDLSQGSVMEFPVEAGGLRPARTTALREEAYRANEPLMGGQVVREGVPFRSPVAMPELGSEFGGVRMPGSPKPEETFYHGTTLPSGEELRPNSLGLIFASPSREEAGLFAGSTGGGRVLPVEIKARNVFDPTNEQHLALVGASDEDRLWDSAYVENRYWIDKIKAAGFDGLIDRDAGGSLLTGESQHGDWNVAVFDRANIQPRSSLGGSESGFIRNPFGRAPKGDAEGAYPFGPRGGPQDVLSEAPTETPAFMRPRPQVDIDATGQPVVRQPEPHFTPPDEIEQLKAEMRRAVSPEGQEAMRAEEAAREIQSPEEARLAAQTVGGMEGGRSTALRSKLQQSIDAIKELHAGEGGGGTVEDTVGLGQRVLDEVLGTAGSLTSAKSMLSPPLLRQGLPRLVTNPGAAFRELATSMKAAVSEETAGAVQKAIKEDPWVRDTSALSHPTSVSGLEGGYLPPSQAVNKGLTWQDLGGTVLEYGEKGAADVHPEELQNLQRSWLGRKIAESKAGTLSDRQAAVEINLHRTNWYGEVAKRMYQAGERDPEDYKRLVQFIEHATQRGSWGQGKLPVFFSTRAMSGRIQFIGDLIKEIPKGIVTGDITRAGVSQEAAKTLVGMTAAASAMVGIPASLGLGDIETKGGLPILQIGNQRFDPWAGWNTLAKLSIGTAEDVLKHGTEGGTENLPQNVTHIGYQRALNFARKGLGSAVGEGLNIATGKDFAGKPYNLAKDVTSGGLAANLAAPFIVADLYDAWHVAGPKGAALRAGPSFFSMGGSDYVDTKPKAKGGGSRWNFDLAPTGTSGKGHKWNFGP